MLLSAVGEIWDVGKNLLAVGSSTGIAKAVFTLSAAFGKCWPGFVLSGRMERSWGQIYLLLLVCAAYWGSLTAKARKRLLVWRGILRIFFLSLWAAPLFLLSQFVKFANIEEDTPSYHRSYDFFVSRFSEMCHSSHDDLDIRTK